MPFLNESTSYDEKSLLALNVAFEDVLKTLKSHDPLHDWDMDLERRTELANILLGLAGTGITDPYVLRSRPLDRLPLPPQSMSQSARDAQQRLFSAEQPLEA